MEWQALGHLCAFYSFTVANFIEFSWSFPWSMWTHL